jgi:hypothetical protein
MQKITKKDLERMIYKENKKQREIAKIYRCSEAWISLKLKKYNIRKDISNSFIGKKFGSLKPIKYAGKDRHSHALFLCACDCGKTIEVLGNSLYNGNTKSCGCKSRKRGKEHKSYCGYEEIRAEYWSRILRGAKDREIKVNITIEEAWDVFLKQNRRCALSGEILHFPYTVKTRKYSNASLDRIDSDLGYEKNNIQWIHKDLNFMKRNMPEKDFLNWCKKITLYKNLLDGGL